MAIIHYDPWQDRFKLPFGAVLIESIAHLNIDVIAEKVLHVYLVIHKDGEEIQYHEMTNQQGTFYSCDYFFNFGTGLYYYHFEIETIENKQQKTYFYGTTAKGGLGKLYPSQAETWEYQITCYKKAEPAPDWYKKGIFYQIFPDRFAKGNGGVISPKKNTFLYATENDDPLYVKDVNGEIVRWDFFGGNLSGIKEKIPYLKELGISGLYLNPIFEASSNHRYDTSDYMKVDAMLGSEEEFTELIQLLHANGIHLILDGVFSHVGQNSRYFNRNGNYGETVGAYQDPHSPYFPWFSFTDYPNDYTSWWGIKDLPEINKENAAFQEFIFGEEGVIDKWTELGVDGWRLDVADELPDHFIASIRKRLESFSDKVLLGEVWEDASNKISYGKRRHYILGDHLQGVMNYPLRNATIELLTEAKGPEEVANSLTRLYENYPRAIFNNNLNNIGTHDTERILTMLSNHLKKLDLAFGMMFVFPGIPCIYYGDEAGLTGGKDPENRKFFPWDHMNPDIYRSCHKWIDYRKDNDVLIEGDLSFFFTEHLFGILRRYQNNYVAYLMNPTNYPKKVNGNLIFIAEETPMIKEIRRRFSNRTIEENSYLLISSAQKKASIEQIQRSMLEND